jgi:hypothetical protein
VTTRQELGARCCASLQSAAAIVGDEDGVGGVAGGARGAHGQNVRTDRDANLYLDSVDFRDGSRTLSALYAYKLNWQTVLYLGYGDLRELTQFNGYAPSARQAFVKVSYAWQR